MAVAAAEQQHFNNEILCLIVSEAGSDGGAICLIISEASSDSGAICVTVSETSSDGGATCLIISEANSDGAAICLIISVALIIQAVAPSFVAHIFAWMQSGVFIGMEIMYAPRIS